MNSNDIFREILNQFKSDDIFDDWRRISQNIGNFGEKDKIHWIITRVTCHGLEMYDAGKEIELLNPSLLSNFPKFLLKFVSVFQNLPSIHQTPIITRLLLKLIDFQSENPKIHVEIENFAEVSKLLEWAGNIITKDLLEMAVNLYPDDGKRRSIGGRDILDGVVLSEGVQDDKFNEPAFLKLKQKLMSLPSTSANSSSSFERSILSSELQFNENQENNETD